VPRGVLADAGLPSRGLGCLADSECAGCADGKEEGNDALGISYSEARRPKSMLRSHAQITPSRPPEYLRGAVSGV